MAWANTITAGTSWQELTVAVEIAEAYNKRAAACGASEITADETVTVFDFVKAVQDGIEAMVVAVQTVNVYATTAWADPDAAVEDAADYPPRFATVADFFAVCGLTGAGGWRRIGAGGTQPAAWTDYADAGWSYGGITDGDLAGPWWWIDLQKALEKITRWTKAASFFESTAVKHIATAITPAQFAAAPNWVAGGNETDSVAIQKFWSSGVLTKTGAAKYTDHLITGLTAESKHVRLTAKMTAAYGQWEDFGAGYTEGTTGVTREWTANTDTSLTGPSLPPPTSWEALAAYVPTPPTGETYQQGFIAGNGYQVFWVVDYLFDP